MSRFDRIRRYFEDYSEASQQAEDGRNPYYWLEPNQFKTDLGKMPYRRYFTGRRRRLTAAVVSPSPKKRARTVYRRAYGKPMMRTRRWKVAARRQVGERVGVGGAKTTEIVIEKQDVSTRTIIQQPLVRIDKGIAINDRLREIINLRGIRIDLHLANTDPDQQIVNWAIVHPKASNMGGTSNGQQFPTTDFFRGYGAQRSTQPAIGLNGVQWINASINTDLFAVLKRGVVNLNPGRSEPDSPIPGAVTYRPNKGNSVRSKSVYLKMNRQLRFESEVSPEYPLEQIFLVLWSDAPFAESDSSAAANAFSYMARFVAYWREPKN